MRDFFNSSLAEASDFNDASLNIPFQQPKGAIEAF